jgi:hypothetical protein
MGAGLEMTRFGFVGKKKEWKPFLSALKQRVCQIPYKGFNKNLGWVL